MVYSEANNCQLYENENNKSTASHRERNGASDRENKKALEKKNR